MNVKQKTTLAVATALLAAGPGAARPQDVTDADEATPWLRATGEAEVSAEPDLAVVRLGATVRATGAAAAQREVNAVMESAIAAIRGAGAPEAAIRTDGVSLQPVHRRGPPKGEPLLAEQGPDRRAERGEEDEEPDIVAYRARNTVRVRLDDLELVGAVIDAGIGAGANRLEGVSFRLRDDSPHYREALRLAVANARLEAEALAEAAGVERLALHRIEEQSVQGGFASRVRVAAVGATSLRPDDVLVRASVELTYRIEVGADGQSSQRR